MSIDTTFLRRCIGALAFTLGEGERFAEAILPLLPGFIADAGALAEMIEAAPDD